MHVRARHPAAARAARLVQDADVHRLCPVRHLQVRGFLQVRPLPGGTPRGSRGRAAMAALARPRGPEARGAHARVGSLREVPGSIANRAQRASRQDGRGRCLGRQVRRRRHARRECGGRDDACAILREQRKQLALVRGGRLDRLLGGGRHGRPRRLREGEEHLPRIRPPRAWRLHSAPPAAPGEVRLSRRAAGRRRSPIYAGRTESAARLAGGIGGLLEGAHSRRLVGSWERAHGLPACARASVHGGPARNGSGALCSEHDFAVSSVVDKSESDFET
mmetsp:Transcript_78661/g.227357  ORF Transcript_78661/g.227357 Transcript_78661/m.227357 type:complete len:277 (-) Transcript_78661:11-841(-)